MATVLVVDDEEPIREVLRDILERAGHVVIEAGEGEEGCLLYRQWKPDAVVTDILMPKKGGLQLIGDVQRFDPAAKIIAMSGGGRDGKLNFLATAKTYPGVRILRKPFQKAELLGVLSELLQVA